MIHMDCPGCGCELEIPDNLAGKSVECSECDHSILVPQKRKTKTPAPKKKQKPHKRSRLTVVRFLSNAYEVFILICFVLSLLAYGGAILWSIIFAGAAADADIAAIGVMGAVGSIIMATIAEAMFLVILGAAAVVVDIRNVLIEQHQSS